VKNSIPQFLLLENPPAQAGGDGRRRASLSLVDRSMAVFARLLQDIVVQCDLASRSGLLELLDARVKVLFWALLLVIISLKSTIVSLASIAAMIIMLMLGARVGFGHVYGKVLPLTVFFGFLLSAPSMLNIFVPGTVILPLITLQDPVSVLTITIPRQIGITEEGLVICLRLVLRVFASLSLSVLMLAVTPFPEVVRALKLFRVPDFLLLILTLTGKYIYLFAQTVLDMYRAMKVRLVFGISAADFRAWSTGRMATIFRKTQMRADDIYRAMLCRGFSGEIRLAGSRQPGRADWLGAGVLAVFVLAALVV